MSKGDGIGIIDGFGSRPAMSPQTLAPVSSGLLLAAFSSVAWIMKTLHCSEAEAVEFKINAGHDFECLMLAVRQAKGRPS